MCMMCRGTSTIITLIIRVTPCFILEKCVKNTMVLDVRARNDFSHCHGHVQNCVMCEGLH